MAANDRLTALDLQNTSPRRMPNLLALRRASTNFTDSEVEGSSSAVATSRAASGRKRLVSLPQLPKLAMTLALQQQQEQPQPTPPCSAKGTFPSVLLMRRRGSRVNSEEEETDGDVGFSRMISLTLSTALGRFQRDLIRY